MLYVHSLALGFILLISQTSNAEPNCSGAYDQTSYYNFKTACFKHDVCYSEGPVLGLSKQACDDRFYSHMKASCKGEWFCLGAANVYYKAVRQFPQSTYDNATAKGIGILNKINSSNDEAARLLFTKRARGQIRWTAKELECSKLDGNLRDICIAERNAILIPDIPGKYHLGDCNTLGIRWSLGHRTGNANYQAKTLGLPIEVVMDRESPGDPCKAYYLD